MLKQRRIPRIQHNSRRICSSRPHHTKPHALRIAIFCHCRFYQYGFMWEGVGKRELMGIMVRLLLRDDTDCMNRKNTLPSSVISHHPSLGHHSGAARSSLDALRTTILEYVPWYGDNYYHYQQTKVPSIPCPAQKDTLVYYYTRLFATTTRLFSLDYHIIPSPLCSTSSHVPLVHIPVPPVPDSTTASVLFAVGCVQ